MLGSPTPLLTSAIAVVLVLAPVAGASAESSTHRVSIRAGDCRTPGSLVAPPWDLTSDAPEAGATPAALPSVVEALAGSPGYGIATLPMPLAEIGSGDNALSVAAEPGEAGSLLACGELAHFVSGPVDVQVGLLEQDGSGPVGVAWLHDNGNGTTTVTVVLATAADPPTGATGDSDHVDATISASRYLPSPVEISVGTTVTWTNEDLLPHTTTADDGDFDSGYMAQGDTYSQTFDAPGTYGIFCVYHPRMRAVVIVE